MQAGDIFTITDDTIKSLEEAGYSTSWSRGQKENKKLFRLLPGMQFRITPKGMTALPVEVYASRLGDSGVAIKGRPRRFPAQLVADLLGTTVPQAAAASPAPAANDLSTGSDEASDTPEPMVKEPQEETAEEIAAREERVKNLLGLLGPDSDSQDNW